MKKSIYVSVISLFLLIAIISGMMIYANFKEANTQEELYESLAEIVEQNKESSETKATEPSENTEPVILPEYAELYEQNGDIVGWITIPDTKINYPVMQSPDNPNFYLKHGFDKGYTDYGCPYVSEECDVNKPSDNLIIYGHNMKNGSMANKCAICGAEVNVFQAQKLSDGNYICRKNCRSKEFKVFDYVHADLSQVTSHIAQVERGTKLWEHYFVPKLKEKNKEKKLVRLGSNFYVAPDLGLMAYTQNDYKFFIFDKTTRACVYRIADLRDYEFEVQEKKTNNGVEKKEFIHVLL